MITVQKNFIAIGECMLEMRHQDDKTLALGYAGDSFNVVLYLARYQQVAKTNAAYYTALGNDPYSEKMLANWHAEDIQTDLVNRIDGKLPGLYLIKLDQHGERSFYYYRAQSAARAMFNAADANIYYSKLPEYDYIYLSGISLAILDEKSLEILFDTLSKAKKQNSTIIFDTNYRPSMWKNKQRAQEVIRECLSYVDIALPTFSDEQNLFGDKTAEDCLARLRSWGIKEVVMKRGAEPCLAYSEDEEYRISATQVKNIVDTTAAGDSFNAGYLAAKFYGFDITKSIQFAHSLASTVIQHHGAVIDNALMPSLA